MQNPAIARPSPESDLVRQRILDAAQAVFADRGYAGASTREIAEAAGIGKRMLFYYFANKDAVYRAVLERVVSGLVAVHAQFQNAPGPIGLGEAIQGVMFFTAQNLPAFKVWMREVMDGGPHLDDLVRQYVAPVYEAAGQEIVRNQEAGVFRAGDPRHMIVNVGGLSLFYFMLLPMLQSMWGQDPLTPELLAAHAAVTRDMLLAGLAGPGRQGESS